MSRTIDSRAELDNLPDGAAYLLPTGEIGRVRKSTAISHALFHVNGASDAIHPACVPLPVTLIWEPTP